MKKEEEGGKLSLPTPPFKYGGIIGCTKTLVRPVQLEKAKGPMLVTPLPMETEVRVLQPSKARLPIEVTLSPIMTVVSLLLLISIRTLAGQL